MKRDVKILIAGLACWLVSLIAIPLATLHPLNFDHPATSTELIYHWTGILGLILLVAGSLAISAAAVSFSERFDARESAIAGCLFVGPAVLYWVIARGREVHTFAWIFLLVPWFVSLVSGALLLLVAMYRAVVDKFRS